MYTALRMTFSAEPQGAMLATGLITMGSGLVLLAPAEAFKTSPTYELMAAVASETIWSLVLIVIGSMMLTSWWLWCAGLVVIHEHPKIQLRSAPSYRYAIFVWPVGAGLWTIIAGSFFVANRAATGWFTYGIVGLGFSVFIAIRVWQTGKAAIADLPPESN